MELQGKVAAVTGAASGIGKALCHAIAAEGAAAIACVDIDTIGATATAQDVGGRAYTVDVSDDAAMSKLINDVENDLGPIDLFVSNAGIFMDGGPERPDADWHRVWNINVMSQVIAARHVVPRMMSRGGGYLLNTASAAGVLNQVDAAPYAVSKHASVALSEWLAFTHKDDGIKVSVLCPQAVESAMTAGGAGSAGLDGIIPAAQAAADCIDAIRDEIFLILPHSQVLGYMRNKTENYDRWLGGMTKLNRAYRGGTK
ncbi:MAG: SDR family NAD(P)-dependent oxidoreductase [Pseudomonadota bacterium]